MKSSFVRKGATTAETGTRPGLHGQTLISTGLTDLDKLLGGGLPLGTVTLIVEDCHSQQHLNLIRYFLAEAVLTGQQAAWIAPRQPHGGVANFLPAVAADSSSSRDTAKDDKEDDDGELKIAWQYKKYIQSAQQQRELEQQQQQSSDFAKAAGTVSTGSASASKVSSSGRTAAQKAVDAGIGRQWCQTYDLSRSMDPDVVSKHGLACDVPQGSDSSSRVNKACSSATSFISQVTAGALAASTTKTHPIPTAAAISSTTCGTPGAAGSSTSGVARRSFVSSSSSAAKGPQSVGRLVVQSLLSPAWCGHNSLDSQHAQHNADSALPLDDMDSSDQTCKAVARMLFQLRKAVQDTKVAVLVTLQVDLISSTWLTRLQHLCDTVITLGSISDSSDVYKLLPDPSTAAALLSFQRLPSVGMLAPKMTDSQVHVIRHKRKKLSITPVDVDPDAQTKQQEAIAAALASLNKMPGPGAGGSVSTSASGKEGGAGLRAAKPSQAAKGFDF